jgi:hypothetical protein
MLWNIEAIMHSSDASIAEKRLNNNIDTFECLLFFTYHHSEGSAVYFSSISYDNARTVKV